MESTLLHSFFRAGNLKRWLAKPDCPAVIKECKLLFDKIYAPKVPEDTNEGVMDTNHVNTEPKTIPEDLRPLLGLSQRQAIMPARLQHNGIIYATSKMHTGNSLVYFYPGGNRSTPVPGSIKYIYQDQGRFLFAVQRQLLASVDTPNPYAIYPDFPAKLYSSQLSAELEQVQVDWIYSHYARWDFSASQSVVLSLSRVCCFISRTSILIINLRSSRNKLYLLTSCCSYVSIYFIGTTLLGGIAVV